MLASDSTAEANFWRRPLNPLSLALVLSLVDWLTTFAVAAMGLFFDHGLAPFEREIGPQLSDPRIAYPHTPIADVRCSKPMLVALAFVLPLLLIASTQLARPSRIDLNHALLGTISSLSLTLVIVSLVKVSVGRLRPDFLARCKPIDGLCTGAPKDIREGRKSFPSGHTALAFASLGFVGFYWAAKLLHARTPQVAGSLWKLLLVLAPWAVALLVGLSRIADYWHHWEDVLAGALVGTVVAYVAYRMRYPPIAEGADPLVLPMLRGGEGKRHPTGEPLGDYPV